MNRLSVLAMAAIAAGWRWVQYLTHQQSRAVTQQRPSFFGNGSVHLHTWRKGMFARRLFARLAWRAPAPVFIVCGAGAEDIWWELLSVHDIYPVDAPGEANILLVAGEIPLAEKKFLQQLHDLLPHPRATLWWNSAPLFSFSGIPGSRQTTALPKQILDTQLALFTGARPSEPDCAANLPPAQDEQSPNCEAVVDGVSYGRLLAQRNKQIRNNMSPVVTQF